MLKRLFTTLTGTLLLLLLAPSAMAGEETVAGSATVSVRSSSWIAVDVPFNGDDNGNGHTVYEIGASAAGPFGGITGGYERLSGPQEWRANIIHVSASTTYYVRITFVDPDGVTGVNPQIVGPVNTPASSPNAVTVEAATAVLHDAEIYVSVPVSDDANRNSGGTIEIATSAGGPWTRKAGSPSEANLPFHPKRARLRGLTPGTDYWIRATVIDPDGVSGTNPQVIGPINYAGSENLALGKSISASPGWGCCPSPSHLVDGRIQNDAWSFGFAWTGGTSCYAGGCPPGLNKHATVDLGAPTEFNRAAMWYHDPGSVPLVWKFQYSNDGVNFTDAYSNTDPICRTASEQMPGAWYHPACGHEAAFTPVTARYVRYLFDDSTLFGGIHGWAVEFEVFNAQCPQEIEDTGTSVAVGAGPSQAVLTPDGSEVYVSNYDGGTVSVIDTATNAVTQAVSVGSGPDALAVAPDGSKIYVGQHGGNVSVIDTATKAVTNVNTLGGPVRDLAITPDGSKVYLAMESAGLKVIDTATNAVSTVSSISCPEGVRVTPDGSTVYVNYQCGGPGGSGGHDAVGRFDANTGAFLGSTTGLPNVGSRLTISPDGAQVWELGGDACSSPFYDHVGCPYVPAGVLNVIATSTNTLQQSIGFEGFAPGLISFLPGGARAVVASSPNLLVFDTSTFNVVQTLPVPGSGSVAFASDGKGYAPVPGENRVAILQLSCDTSNTPAFSGLSSPTITYGTTEATLSGTIGGGAGVPTGDVEITLDGTTALAPIQPDGSFAATFDTFTLGAGAHPIAYHFGGDANYEGVDGAGTLTVTKATPSLKVFGGTFAFDGQPHPATGAVTGVNGEDLGSPSLTYNGSPDAPVSIGVYAVSATFAGDANYNGVSSEAVSVYINDGTPAPGDVGTYWVTNLGTLGGLFSTATSVNAVGQVAGYSETASGEIHAFFYSGGVMNDLGTLGGAHSVATGINATGDVVGYSQTAAGEFHAFLYSGGVMTDLGTLGGADSFAYGVNDGGVVVGESQTASGSFHAFSYSGGAMTDLGTLPGGSYSAANSVNTSGYIAGYSETASGDTHVFAYGNNIMADLGALPGDSSATGTGVNDAGQVAGYSTRASGGTHAVFFNGLMRDLGVLSNASDFSRAFGISGAAIVGHSVNDAGESRGFVFDPLRGMRDLNPLIPADAGVVFNEASGVNGAGQIVGAGDFEGQTVALLLTPVLATTTAAADVTVTYNDAAQQVALTATVSATGGAVVNEGTVTFRVKRDGVVVGSPITSAPLTNGTAGVNYTLPPATGARDYLIEATYNDGPRFTGGSGTATLTVLRAATSAALTSSANPSIYGRPVTFTAIVTSGGGGPTGNVEFRDGGSVLATVPLNAVGRASLNIFSLSAGAHPVTAVYVGDLNFLSSTSPVLTQTVNKASTATTLSGPDSSVFGQNVTFVATVAPLPAGPFTPTGQVQFKINGVNAAGGLKSLVNGQATYSTSNLGVGTHVISADYQGDANFKPSSGSKTHRRR